MSIREATPNTESSLRKDLASLGAKRETTLMVHSSLSSIGWVLGGASTVVRVLLDILGEKGTLVMPSSTPNCSDPASWKNPKLPEAWFEEVREHLPVFDRQTTPTSRGAISETFRTWPGTLRSNHPLESVCARGVLASEITREHPLAFSQGRDGPYGKLYEWDSRVLLLGVGFNRCTALHFAESLVEKHRIKKERFPTLDNGRRVWVEVSNVGDDNDTHFPIIGRQFVSAGRARQGSIGQAQSTLFPMRDLVDYAVGYFETML